MKGEIVSFEKAADRCCNVLPGNVVVKILQRLPVKSLLRFESVSKDWLSLILHPQFITKHLLHNQQKAATYLHRYHHTPHCRNDIVKIYISRFSSRTNCCPRDHHQIGISLISKRDNDDQNNPFSTSVLTLDHHMRDDNISIVGTSNGLVCLKFDRGHSFGIWNPATRKFKFLPRPQQVFFREHGHIGVGFSYVPSTTCYKLVRISALKDANGSEYVTRVLVLDIGQDCWREVLCHGQYESYEVFELPFYLYTSPVVVNGCLYWIGSTIGEKRSMVSFDLEKEVFFKQTTLPYPFDDDFN